MFLSLIAATIAVALASTPADQADCPCFTTEDQPWEWICDNRNLTTIPDCVPLNTGSIVIRTPTIPLVQETIVRFTELYRVVIERMEENPVIAKDFLYNHPHLKHFHVYRTGLDYVDNDWFANTHEISTLILSYNNIKSLSVDTFKHVPLLTSVFLNNNALTTLPPTLFEGTKIGVIYTHTNPWNCDCELASFIQWSKDKANVSGGICSHPSELEGTDINDLSPDLACK